MDDTEHLRNAGIVRLKLRRSPKSNETTRLGDVLNGLVGDWISPQQSRFESVSSLLEELLPGELYSHCKLADISGGQLKVVVDSPSYMHELRLCSPQLVKELQRRCPQARIKKIKLAIG